VLSKSDAERIKEMGTYLDPDYIADVYKVPADVIEDVLRGNIQGDKKETTENTPIKVVEKARFVRNKTICAVSPGGGKGKTSVLVSLAILAALHSPGNRPIAALDLAEFGKMALHMGFRSSENTILPEILHCSDKPDREEIYNYLSIQHPQIENLFVLPGIQVADRHCELKPAIINKILDALQRHFELVMVDLPARVDLWDNIIQRSDMVLVVSDNNYQSIEGIMQLLPTLVRLDKEQQCLLIVNQTNIGIKQGEFQRILSGLCDTKRTVAAWLPFESSIPEWLNGSLNQHFILSNLQSKYANELTNLLARLCPDWNLSRAATKKKGFWGWFKRV